MRERLDHPPFDYTQHERDSSLELTNQGRMLVTAGLVAWPKPETVVDPAAGEGTVVFEAYKLHPFRAILGDISLPNYHKLVAGKPPGAEWHIHNTSIENTIRRAAGADMIILSEILEHLEDPDAVLRLARENAELLVASSPEMRPFQADNNPEHLWKFDGVGYREMLEAAGWHPYSKTHLTFRPRTKQEDDTLMVEIGNYDFQIWLAGRG